MKKFNVTIESRGGHNGAATGGHYGSWAEVYASALEFIKDIRIAEEEHDYTPGRLSYHEDYVVVEVEIEEEKMNKDDYLIVHHRRSPNPFLRGSSSRESFELLAGTMPAWADFPAAYKEWVSKKHYEAIFCLEGIADIEKYKKLGELVAYAKRKTAKNRIISAWYDVFEFLKEQGLLRYEPTFTSSWTGATAMPVKIAQAVDWGRLIKEAKENKVYIERFIPKDKPRWAEPDADAIKIASPKLEGYILHKE